MHRALPPALALALILPAVGVASSPADPSCERHDRLVALDPASGMHALVGWLCGASGAPGQTVIIASPTGLAHHAYWDWPYEPEAYSFVRDMVAAGYAVYNYDRIGTGLSDRPAAALVNVESEAYVVQQLAEHLRALGFGRVVHAGNSLSTFIGIVAAERYDRLDGLIDTGILVGPTPTGLATLFAAFYPAQLDPKFADADIPPGYATTQPGSRAAFFHLPASDPSVVALDEALKDTATLGEATTFPSYVPGTRLVDVPILSIVGGNDVLFCSPVCEPDGLEAQRERLFWSDATCFELPDTGHFVQLQPNSAAATEGLALDWLARRIGNAGAPPSAPCA